MDMYKVNGANERQDSLIRISDNNYLLMYGFGKESEDAETGYNWRKYYDHKPTLEEIKCDIIKQVNANTEERILSGFTWNDMQVCLTTVNQYNYKAAYDMAVQTNGDSLPVIFKFGDEEPTYYEFKDLDMFKNFYTKALQHIQQCLEDGWKEKDDIDWDKFVS